MSSLSRKWDQFRSSSQRRAYGEEAPAVLRASLFAEISQEDALGYLREVQDDRSFNDYLDSMGREWEEKGGKFDLSLSTSLSRVLYVLIRGTSPAVVVETGVGGGRSTAHILRALAANQRGTLYSIDLPLKVAAEERTSRTGRSANPEVAQPSGLEVGWLIPPNLKEPWRLIEGDSRTELPRLLDSIGTVDLFYHDSLHTYEHMMFEYNCVWPNLRMGGLLLSDDVTQKFSQAGQVAFLDFCQSKGTGHVLVKERLGVTRKPGKGAHPTIA